MQDSILTTVVKTIDGEATTLEKYAGNVLLIVNVASKCGLTPQYEQLENIQKTWSDRGFVVLGFPCNQFLEQEPGSDEEIKRIKDKYNIYLHTINLGGGLGIKYTENDAPISVYEIAETIISSIKEHSKKYEIEEPTVYIEPGRSIVGTAGVTLYTAGSSKQVPNGRKYQAVDGGMSDNARPSLYQAKYTVEIANNPKGTADEKVTIAGKHCESGDILAKDIMLPEIEEGDTICFYTTGAYGYSMSSNYNRVLKAAAVLVNNGKSDIIINRQTYEQLCESDVIPERLN